MSKLIKFTLDKNKQKNVWELTNDKTDKVIKTFDTKAEATAGGALKKAVGDEGASVKIKLENNKIQEERTFPRKDDPRESKG
ncbi:DUF2188 domain-containing protein [Candidatus Gracilibacteria bacterium]|nr:DUF2188 domain-containing protein [Candidatus Gracilibacteria bacterium]